MDLFFARMLKKENCISWYGEGNKYDDHRALIPTDYLPSEIIKPGFYSHYCVEVDIGLMALNAILSSDELKNIDKDASHMMEIEGDQ